MFIAKKSIARQDSGSRWFARVAPLLTLGVLAALPLFVSGYLVLQMTLIIIYAIAIMSLNFLTGGSGQFSLGHGAFFAAGAYTCAILMESGGMAYWLTLPAAGAVCFLFGFLFGFPALRLKGVYLALATFSIAVAAPQIIKLDVFQHWTGGAQGMVLFPPEAPLNLPIDQDKWLYIVSLSVGSILYVVTINLMNSRTGRAMKAIRDNQIAASAMGVNLALYKTLAFGISAGMTGVAGALGALAVAFVAPDSYSIHFSNALFLGMIVGGIGWLPGSLAGAAFIVLVPNLAESISQGLSGAVFGLIVIAVIFLCPRGAQQAVCSLRDLFGGKKTAP